MKPSRKLIVLTIAVTVGSTAYAIPKTHPGQYSYHMGTQIMGMKLPDMNYEKCVTQQDIDDNKQFVNDKKQKNCEKPVVTWKGNDFTVVSHCSNPTTTSTGVGTATDTEMHMTITVDMAGDMPVKTIETMTAKRTGDCK